MWRSPNRIGVRSLPRVLALESFPVRRRPHCCRLPGRIVYCASPSWLAVTGGAVPPASVVRAGREMSDASVRKAASAAWKRGTAKPRIRPRKPRAGMAAASSAADTGAARNPSGMGTCLKVARFVGSCHLDGTWLLVLACQQKAKREGRQKLTMKPWVCSAASASLSIRTC